LEGIITWWYVILYNFKANLAYRTTAFFIIIRDLIPLTISLTIYGSIAENNNYLVYFLVGNLFFRWLTLFGDINWEIRHAIAYGQLSKHLLRPFGWIRYEFMAVIGGNFYPIVINTLIFSIAIIISQINLDFSWNLPLLIPFFILACVIYFCIDLMVGCITFWTPETNVLIDTKAIATPFLAGSLAFLDTNAITQTFVYLPWSYMMHHPMQVYLGNYSLEQTLWSAFGGLVWSIVLITTSTIVLKNGLRKNESVGL
jgi:ABC-2 type transport system permease protein